MSGPSVVVDWAPEGWTHIGGPGMHLLIALDEDDEQTLMASDAADGGDLDDVLDVLTTGGMRRARHFVGVHWQPHTRLVAHGPVAVVLTLADGSEHEVRPTSARVWTDLELPEHPTHVRLRVLDAAEADQPPPPVTLGAAAHTGTSGPGDDSVTDQPPAADSPLDHESLSPATPVPPLPHADVAPSSERAEAGPSGGPSATAAQQDPAVGEQRPAAVVPTFVRSAPADAPTTSPWQRSWAQHSPSVATTAADATPQLTTPPVATRAAIPPAPESPAPQSPAPASPPPDSPAPASPVAQPTAVDVESTLSARPVPEPVTATGTGTGTGTEEGGGATADGGTADAGAGGVAPSYDYLFGHTTTVDEHRRVLAELERPHDDEQDDEQSDQQDDEPDDDSPAVAPVVSAAAAATVSSEASPPAGQRSLDASSPPPTVVAEPVPSAGGGLISSVPWATPAATGAAPGPAEPADPGPAPEVPTFAGRHTPPPAPSLLPPAIAGPPGTRPPTATPIITTGPPPAAKPSPPPATSAAVVPQLDPAVVAPSDPPTAPADATPSVNDDEAELTVDRSALIQARDAARNQVSTGPSVLAVLCSAGHPTPPHGERCRICGSGIPPQEPFAMPRPPLGVLRLSTGDVVTLDRSVLLGRAPHLSESHSAADRPHVVKVPSPERDVSRNHVEVVLEGWHVLIRDLGTTNGTTVSLPGETPVRLRANDQQVLEAGSLVSMADEVSFVFEAAP